jgi:hypothetical protein
MFFWIFFTPMVIAIGLAVFGEFCYRKRDKALDKYSGYDWHYSQEKQQQRREAREAIQRSWYGKIGDFWCDESTPFLVGMGVLIAIVAIMLLGILICYGTAPGEEAKYEARYESLMYQYENAIFENDSDVIGNKQLYDEIREYNETISVGKTYTNNFWWGIFWADYYNDLPLIELN